MHDLPTDRLASCKKQIVKVLFEQCLGCFLAPFYHAKGVFVKVVKQSFGNNFRGMTGMFRWFDYRTVTCSDCADKRCKTKVQRIVPGTYDKNNAIGFRSVKALSRLVDMWNRNPMGFHP